MSEKIILPIYNYSNISLPHDWKDKIINLNFPEEDIFKVISQSKVSREKAIYSLMKSEGNCEYAFTYLEHIKYELKFAQPEKGIETIISIPSLDESRIFCFSARPIILTTNAKKHYGVNKIEDMVGKNVSIFRRVKDEFGNYETPHVYHLQKGIIEKIKCPWRYDMADIVIQTEDKISQSINITRICIDW